MAEPPDHSTDAHAHDHAHGDLPGDLSHAGAVIDKAIEYLVSQDIGPMAIASALLGGSLGLLARSMSDAAIVQILENAVASVRAGELRQPSGEH